jgi:hypothetical protein
MFNLPILSKEHEEFEMLREWTEEFPKQAGSPSQKSGKATQIVIHNHLLMRKRLNVAKDLDARIPEKGQMNLLFLLKTGINSAKPEYSLDEVNTVINVTNNAVGDKLTEIENKFKRFREKQRNLRFAIVVLIERSNYQHKIEGRNVFTLLIHKERVHPLYLKETIVEMQENGKLWKTGKWQELIDHFER